VLLFPNRHGGLKAAWRAVTPLDRSGIQATLRKVAVNSELLISCCRTKQIKQY